MSHQTKRPFDSVECSTPHDLLIRCSLSNLQFPAIALTWCGLTSHRHRSIEPFFMSLAARDSEFRRWSGRVDRRICQTFAASPAEPGELPLGFSFAGKLRLVEERFSISPGFLRWLEMRTNWRGDQSGLDGPSTGCTLPGRPATAMCTSSFLLSASAHSRAIQVWPEIFASMTSSTSQRRERTSTRSPTRGGRAETFCGPVCTAGNS
jgi:hypothetical protein